MGTDGMRYSLQSRDLIADQVETAAGGHWLDGMVVLPGCDKNMPGVLMARASRQYMRSFLLPLKRRVRSRQVKQAGHYGVRRHNPPRLV